jgi:hypothetical protein
MKPWMKYLIVVALVPLLVFLTRSLGQVGVGQVVLSANDPVLFPSINGSNLNGRKFNLPEGFEAELNLVAIAFFTSQQGLVDSWGPAVRRLMAEHKNLKFYEMPTLSLENGVVKAFIDGGMRSGIPDESVREVTITVYLDRIQFLKSIGETRDNTIHLLLVNRQGKILWRGHDAYSKEQEDSLKFVLKP